MFQQTSSRIKSFDWILFGSVILLFLIGLSTIYSTVLAGEGQSFSLITKQLLALALGLMTFAIITWIDIKYVYYLTPALYIVSVILLAVLLFYTDPIRGIKGWFVLGPVQVQPAEFVKITLAFTLASYVQLVGSRMKTWKGLLGALVILGLPLFLIALQPDLGTALVVMAIGMGILFFSPIDLKKIAVIGVIMLAVSPLGYAALEDYQKARITSFLSPNADPLGGNYNQIQSIIAVGSGEITGRGWGRGTQSHLRFLPEQHTDFIFATFSEEFGFLGAFVVLALFGILTVRIVVIALNASDLYSHLVLIGMVLFIFSQMVVNIGMNIGVLPVAGLPLPFMSYGGSSLIANLIAIGCVESVAIRRST